MLWSHCGTGLWCAGADPLVADNEFRLSPEQLEAVITPKTKALVLPYPSNPTGGIMERADLEALVPILKKHGIVVISDEIYAELTYGTHHVSMANIPEMYDQTLVVNGMSKSYSMTGLAPWLCVRPQGTDRPDDQDPSVRHHVRTYHQPIRGSGGTKKRRRGY